MFPTTMLLMVTAIKTKEWLGALREKCRRMIGCHGVSGWLMASAFNASLAA